MGGTDQKFNLLMGRTLQEEYNQKKQIIILMPLLEGVDGNEKMSKSLGNYIGINDKPNEMYTKIMKISDDLILKYFELATDIHSDEIAKIKSMLDNDKINPRDIKMKLLKYLLCLLSLTRL